jgi:hypothetical protein
VQKRCPKCGDTEPVDGGFYLLPTGRVSGYCRACVAADKRRRYTERPEVRARAIAQAQAYRAAHKERLAAAQREWEVANEVLRQRQRRERADQRP